LNFLIYNYNFHLYHGLHYYFLCLRLDIHLIMINYFNNQLERFDIHLYYLYIHFQIQLQYYNYSLLLNSLNFYNHMRNYNLTHLYIPCYIHQSNSYAINSGHMNMNSISRKHNWAPLYLYFITRTHNFHFMLLRWDNSKIQT